MPLVFWPDTLEIQAINTRETISLASFIEASANHKLPWYEFPILSDLTVIENRIYFQTYGQKGSLLAIESHPLVFKVILHHECTVFDVISQNPRPVRQFISKLGQKIQQIT